MSDDNRRPRRPTAEDYETDPTLPKSLGEALAQGWKVKPSTEQELERRVDEAEEKLDQERDRPKRAKDLWDALSQGAKIIPMSDEELDRRVARAVRKYEAEQRQLPDRWITDEELLAYPPGSVTFKADSDEERHRRIRESLGPSWEPGQPQGYGSPEEARWLDERDAAAKKANAGLVSRFVQPAVHPSCRAKPAQASLFGEDDEDHAEIPWVTLDG
jgi:hypothetical protein